MVGHLASALHAACRIDRTIGNISPFGNRRTAGETATSFRNDTHMVPFDDGNRRFEVSIDSDTRFDIQLVRR